MISSEKIKTFLTSAVDSIKSIVKTDKKEENNEIKNAVKNKTDENSLIDTSKLEENKEDNSKFKKALGVIALASPFGVSALGVSKIVEKVKEKKAEKEAKELEEKKQQRIEQKRKEKEEFQKACEVNGKIDQKVSQGRFGDCALIASMYALGNSEKGAQILKDAITTNYDENGNVESYTIDYKGIGEKVTVTKKELDERNETYYCEGLKGNTSSIHIGSGDDYYVDTEGNEGPVRIYSKGDDDMLLLEIGWEKLGNDLFATGDFPVRALTDFNYDSYFSEVKTNSYKADYLEKQLGNIKGEFKLSDIGLKEGEPVFAWDDNNKYDLPMNKNDIYEIEKIDDDLILLKNKTKNIKGKVRVYDLAGDYMKLSNNKANEIRKNTILKAKNHNYDFMTADFGFKDDKTINDVKGEERTLKACHAYAVKKITDKTITLINPWDTSEDLTFTLDEFAKIDFNICAYNIK